MALEIFSIVIAIAICRVPFVAVHIAFVEVGATPGFSSAIIDVAIAALDSGSVTVLETSGRAIAAAETPGAIATAFNAAGRTTATAAAPVAASAAVTATASAAVTATASAAAGTTAAATQRASTAAATSASAAVVGGEIDKVGAGVGRGLEVQHWRRIGDRRA
jgi:hypothetical protein